MSDDLGGNCHHAILHNDETYIKLADASVTFQHYRKMIAAKDAEITRFGAWRDAINDALTNWLDAITDDDTPEAALRRLKQYEITTALNPAVSQSAAHLVATARNDALEEAADLCEDIIEHWAQVCAICIREIKGCKP